MFTIGQFARLTGVSPKRLRHYERMGLFRPAWVDPLNRYRYYTTTQIPDLRRIAALVDLGIPLRRIRELREKGGSLASELDRRRRQLQQERAALDRRLAELDIRLERSGDLDVVVSRRPPGRWATLEAEVEAGSDLAPLFVEVESHVQRHDARAARPPICIVHRSRRRSRCIELLIPIDREVPASGRVTTTSTPGSSVVSSLVIGGYDRLSEVTSGLEQWAQATGWRVTGPPWYVYLRFSAEEHLQLPAEYLTTDRDEIVTEVMMAVEPSAQTSPSKGSAG